MIVSVALLFRRAGLVMAGTSMNHVVFDGFNRFNVPAYGMVFTWGNTAFSARPNGKWFGEAFTAEEIAERRTLICPHCKKEWPEECRCSKNPDCKCWRCNFQPDYFEPARDKEAENLRNHERACRNGLESALGHHGASHILAIVEGDPITADYAVMYAKDSMSLPGLILLDSLDPSSRRITKDEILEGLVALGLPKLIDPRSDDPPKTRKWIEQFLHAVREAKELLDSQCAR